MDIWLQDVRYAIRSLRRSSGFSIMAVLTLALGIGSTTTIFSLIDGVLLRPLPYKDPDRLFIVREIVPAVSHLYPSFGGNVRHVSVWRQQCSSFSDIAVAQGITLNLTGGGEPEQLQVVRASANLFTTLGISPLLGRSFVDEEDQPGRNKVVILSHSFWQRRYDGDGSVVGKRINLNGNPYEIVGVLPASFRFPKHDDLGPLTELGERADVFTPLGIDLEEVSPIGAFDFGVIARLMPDVTTRQAQAELGVAQASIGQSLPRATELLASLEPLQAQIVRNVRRGLLLLLTAVGAILLIGCVNLANLLLVRGETRHRDWAIRTALGASRARIIRCALTESVILALVGGSLGLLLTIGAVQLLIARAPVDLPRFSDVQFDVRMFAFALFLSTASGILFAILPAWRLTKIGPNEALVSSSHRITGGPLSRRMRGGMISAEVAMSTTLLILTALMLVSILKLTRVDKGFNEERLLCVDIALPSTTYQAVEQRRQFFQRLLRNLEQMPTVVSAAVVSTLPLQGDSWVDVITQDGEQKTDLERPLASFRFVNPSFFETLGVALREGRVFSESDRDRPVAMVSVSAARRVWVGQNPIGQRFRRGNQDITYEIVGVVSDVRTVSLDQTPGLMVYIPYWGEGNQGPGPPLNMSLAVRTMDESQMAASQAIRSQIYNIDPTVPLGRIQTMREIVNDSISGRRFQSMLLILFTASALLLAGIGIYGVSAYIVTRRTNEIGVRMALGATASHVRRLILRQTFIPVLVGLVVGISASIALGRVMESLLFDVSTSNPLVMAAVVLVVTALSVVATYVPIRRAVSINPIEALRVE